MLKQSDYLIRMKDRTEILTEDEIITLKKELRLLYLLSFSFFLMVVFMIHVFVFVKFNKWIIPNYEIILIIGLVTIYYFLTYLITRQIRTEIQQGQKIVEHRAIEEKYDFLDKQDRFSAEYRKYVIIAERQKFIVTEEQYKSAEISDFVVVHKTPLRETQLRIEIEKITNP